MDKRQVLLVAVLVVVAVGALAYMLTRNSESTAPGYYKPTKINRPTGAPGAYHPRLPGEQR